MIDEDRELFGSLRKVGHFLFYLMGDKSGQRRVLFQLDYFGEMTQKELQERLSVKSSTMSEMICKMENNNLIDKRPSPKDKRSIVLSLSAAGRLAANRNKDAMDQLTLKLFECLSEQEKQQMLNFSQRLLEHWKKLEEDGTLSSIERGINNV